MKYSKEITKISESIENRVVRLQRFATLNKIENIMRDLDVKLTNSLDVDIKRDYGLILRYLPLGW